MSATGPRPIKQRRRDRPPTREQQHERRKGKMLLKEDVTIEFCEARLRYLTDLAARGEVEPRHGPHSLSVLADRLRRQRCWNTCLEPCMHDTSDVCEMRCGTLLQWTNGIGSLIRYVKSWRDSVGLIGTLYLHPLTRHTCELSTKHHCANQLLGCLQALEQVQRFTTLVLTQCFYRRAAQA